MGSLGSGIRAFLFGLAMTGPVAAECAPGTVELRSPTGIARFHVEVATTAADHAKGLMFREKMAAASGMLFVFDPPKHARFWMKNTLIPLDMIFADSGGRVTVVQANAVPQDTTPLDGGDGVAFVLEINGGLAKRLGIAPGAVMRHSLIAQDGALWSCSQP